jgi:membrane protein YdbS with pleckstrin-like domain
VAPGYRRRVAYPEDTLGPDEQVLLHRHPHWGVLVGPVVALLVVAAAVGFVAAATRGLTWRREAWSLLGLAALALLVRFSLVPALRWSATHLVVTDDRVLVREGVLRRAGLAVPVHRLTGVRYRHGVLDRVLGTGTLVLEAAGAEPVELDRVPRVARVHAELYHRAAAVRSDPDGLDPDDPDVFD